ncbi:sodium- and chloride-dependent GABA transporter 1-like [Ornithodoros turicata]|uniref:sodium- and chloride-dependent GABA transporter 1-like n=1 Tax=Ornithodoros turicata TaxID=34597 RepID=UPI003138F2BD
MTAMAEENAAPLVSSNASSAQAAKDVPLIAVDREEDRASKQEDHRVESSQSAERSNEFDRGKWEGKLDFVFGCINYAVGLGNVWRFPYLCYENGGGAFLVPYFFCLIMTAIPTFYLEVALGQYVSKGSIGVWNLVPMFRGIGMASMVIVFFSNVYYIIIVSWIIFYLTASFSIHGLPWEHCGNYWNSEHCHEFNGTATINDTYATPIQEYWEWRVLKVSSGLEDLGALRGELAVYLLIAWIIVYFVIWKGIHKSGKIIWFTALFPYVIMGVLLIRGVTLPGAATGLYYYISPTWGKLLSPQVWIAAGTQVFYTFGVGFGSVIALGSYNKFHHNFFRDSMVLCVVNPLTSIMAGTVIFSVLGHLSHLSGRDVGAVVKSGPGLAFLAYPEVVAKMPGAPVWSVLFFLMLLILGIDSQFCTAEALVAGFTDVWPWLVTRRKSVTLLFCMFQFLLGLPMVTQGGIYIFHLVDTYAVSGMTLLFIVFFQNVSISWAYGTRKFCSNVKEMIGHPPNIFFRLTWQYVVPFVCVSIFVSSIIQYEPPTYAKTYVYPWWGQLLGWSMGLVSMAMIPLYMVYFISSREGSLANRIREGLIPKVHRIRRPSNDDVPLHAISKAVASGTS